VFAHYLFPSLPELRIHCIFRRARNRSDRVQIKRSFRLFTENKIFRPAEIFRFFSIIDSGPKSYHVADWRRVTVSRLDRDILLLAKSPLPKVLLTR
jgi:hypothetical protein